MIKWIALICLTLGLAACSSSQKATDAKTDVKKEATDAKASTVEKGKAAAVASAGKLLCESKGDKRYIEIRTKDAGCELAYTKFDKEEIIATSGSGTEHCQKISERIMGNLKDAGFKCGE